MLGDAALLLDFVDESRDAGELLKRALSAAHTLERAKLPGVIEIISAYQSVALFLKETDTDISGLSEQVSASLTSAQTPHPERPPLIELPICYDGDFALDAIRIAKTTKLPIAKVIELHSSTEFSVACIGFMPGFPYLAGLPNELHLPRLPTPRTKVPAGSVAIANGQTGIYPFESPGGWNIIGRTPLQLFDAGKNPPALLAPGDRVRFRQMTRAEFDAVKANEK